MNWGFWNKNMDTDQNLPDIFPFPVVYDDFIRTDIIATYTQILTDTVERTHGLTDKEEEVLWDNCMVSDAPQGLISLLATAMEKMNELFLVYNKGGSGVLRQADQLERAQIQADYKLYGKSSAGVQISFQKYRRTEMLRIYSGFEYYATSSLFKNVNLSKAVQIKINDMRASVSLHDASVAKDQAKLIATALKCGKDILLDSKDVIETASIDMGPVEKTVAFLDEKRSFILGLPLSYISGEQTGGIGSTGEADMRAVERGLKRYFESIIKPVFKALFGKECKFQSKDFREITSALEALKTFDLIGEELVPVELKKQIIARMFDVPVKDLESKVEVVTPPVNLEVV